MKRFAAMAALCLGPLAGAQQRPDFSGEWRSAEDRATSVSAAGDAQFRRGEMGSGWGSTIRITQRPDSLILEYDFFSSYDLQPPIRLAYSMNGSESRQTVMIGHAGSEQRSRVSWRGDTLVVSTTYPAPKAADGRAASAETVRTLNLESPTSLVVETTRVGVLGGATTTTKTVYTKR